MKVLLIHNYYQISGGEDKYVKEIESLLKQKKVNFVTYYKLGATNSFIDKIRAVLGLTWNFATYREIDLLIKKEQPTIAHINNVYPFIGLMAYFALKKNKVPIIQSINNFKLLCPKGSLYRESQKCELCTTKGGLINSIRYTCYHSSSIASFFFSLNLIFFRLLRIEKHVSCWIFSTPFSLKYFKERKVPLSNAYIAPIFLKERAVTLQRKKYDFIYVGRLEADKGVSSLILIAKKYPHIKFAIVGRGALAPYISSHKLNNVDLFINASEEMKNVLIARSRCLVAPSLCYENGPYALIEAYSHGVPVIAPREGGFINKVINNKSGLLFTPLDFDDLEKKMLFFVKKKCLFRRQHSYIKNIFNENYTQKAFFSIIFHIYSKYEKNDR